MLVHHGYSDGSGNYFITINSEKCDACGACINACPANVFCIFAEDENDPLNDRPVVSIDQEKRNKIKYECAQCKKCGKDSILPCLIACPIGAISHSW